MKTVGLAVGMLLLLSATQPGLEDFGFRVLLFKSESRSSSGNSLTPDPQLECRNLQTPVALRPSLTRGVPLSFQLNLSNLPPSLGHLEP
jgi:hypothetical protein